MLPIGTIDRRRAVSWFYIAQAALVVGWWLLLIGGGPVRSWFVGPDGWPTARAWLPFDLVLLALPSALTGVAVAGRRRWSRHAAAVTSFGALLGFVVSVRWMAEPVDRWTGAVCMAVVVAADEVARRMVP